MPESTIKENLITTNFRKGNQKKNLFIVIHHTLNEINSTDKFAPANYRVDKDSTIWCLVKPTDIAWHCGTTGTYFHQYCRNSNSIGIEIYSMVNSYGQYYFQEDEINVTAKLVASLMKSYNIPISNVIRHYDVTHKICPEPFVRDSSQWENFIKLVSNYYNKNNLFTI